MTDLRLLLLFLLRLRMRAAGRLRGRDPPNRIPHVVGDEQSAAAIDRDSHGPAERIAVAVEETGQNARSL